MSITKLCEIAQIITPISIIISSIIALYISLRHTRAKLKIKTTLGILMERDGDKKEYFVPLSTYDLPVININDIILKVAFSNCGYCDIFINPLTVRISRKQMCTPFPVEPGLIKAGEISHRLFQFGQILKELPEKQRIKWDKLKIQVYTSRGHFKNKLGTKKNRIKLEKIIKKE